MNSIMNPSGKVTVRLYDQYGKIKYENISHNIITAQGDAYIADLLALTPARQKINGTNCYIAVGTGYTGIDNKNQTWVNTQTGPAQLVTTLYPQLAAVWGVSGDNQLNFAFTYAAGTLNATGINEAVIVSANVQGVTTTCLAYAQISSLNVSISDSLAVTWQVLFNGT
jgi:hypothetical protein